MPATPPPPHIWLHHLEDEADAAFLYRELARAERDPRKADLYRKLAAVEDRHVEMWRKLLAENGHARRSRRRRRGAPGSAPGWPAGWARDSAAHAARGGGPGGQGLPAASTRSRPTARSARPRSRLAKESKEHAETLAPISGGERRALAQDRGGRLPPERGLRLQRRAHRQLRPGGRHDRRAGRPADGEPRGGGRRPGGHGGRRALDGLLRATSRPRASARCSSTRSRWRRRRSG